MASEPPVLETLLEDERCVALQRAITELPGDFREALLLRCEQSLSFAEIALVVGAKEETVRWRVYKARQLLLKQIATPTSPEETLS
jgi:RNA polymerase sigma-70 factor (ECF subfamily)